MGLNRRDGVKQVLGRIALYGSALAIVVTLLALRVVRGPRASDTSGTGVLLVFVVLLLFGLWRRWQGRAPSRPNPGLCLYFALMAIGGLLLIYAVLQRPSSPWLEAATIASLLIAAAAHLMVYRRERYRDRLRASQPTTPDLGLPPEIEATYWRVMRGEPVGPEERARLGRWIRPRRRSWRMIFRRGKAI